VWIGIIGAGRIGSTLAKLWVDAGHEIRLASRHPEQLEPLLARLGKLASAGTPQEAAKFGNVILLTVPVKAVQDVAMVLGKSLSGKIVLDTGNADERRDGDAARDALTHPAGSAGWAASMFPGSRWVKAFNTVYYKTLETQAHRSGDRVGIPLAGDDDAALRLAAALARDAGFDPVIVGPLVRGKDFEPNTPPYNTGMTGRDLRAMFAQSDPGGTSS
jgi:predicted dinucleotide-binding enzyme